MLLVCLSDDAQRPVEEGCRCTEPHPRCICHIMNAKQVVEEKVYSMFSKGFQDKQRKFGVIFGYY